MAITETYIDAQVVSNNKIPLGMKTYIRPLIKLRINNKEGRHNKEMSAWFTDSSGSVNRIVGQEMKVKHQNMV